MITTTACILQNFKNIDFLYYIFSISLYNYIKTYYNLFNAEIYDIFYSSLYHIYKNHNFVNFKYLFLYSLTEYSNNHFIKINLNVIYCTYIKLYHVIILYLILLFLLTLNFFYSNLVINTFLLLINIIKNELENNLSNFFDISNIVIIFICLLLSFVVNSYISDGLFKYLTSFALSLFLNIVTLFVYLFCFSVNSFIYIKGVYSKFKIFIFLIDSITITIFITRLFLQLLRLLICISIFYLIHEMSYLIFESISNFDLLYSYNTQNILNKILFFIIILIKTIFEYFDMLINLSTQFAIYIISIM